MIGVWIYMAYAIIEWRASQGRPRADRSPRRARGATFQIQSAWIVLTTVLVLFLFGFGTYELIQPEGAGGGQGPTPIWTPASHTCCRSRSSANSGSGPTVTRASADSRPTQLIVPDNTTIAFHVTSLDVIHDVLGVPARGQGRRQPEQDNVAFTTPASSAFSSSAATSCAGSGTAPCTTTGSGRDADRVRVLGDVHREAARPEHQAAAAVRVDYTPDANGADGGYYPDTADPYSPVETYGAQQPGGCRATMAMSCSRTSEGRERHGADWRMTKGAIEQMAQSTLEAQGLPTRRECRCTRRSASRCPRGSGRTSGGRSSARSAASFFGHWIGNIIAGNYPVAQNTSGRTTSPLVLALGIRGGRLAHRHRRAQVPAAQDGRARARAVELPTRAGRGTSDDRGPQGRGPAVHHRRPDLLLHRRPARDAHPHRAPQPEDPRLRPGVYIAIVSEHGTIMMMMATSVVVGTARQLAGPAHDRLASHGLPTGRGVLVLDLHGRVPRDPVRTVPRRVPDRLDRLRAAADPGAPRVWTRTSSASRPSASA